MGDGLLDLSLRASSEIYMLLPSLLVVPLGRAHLVGPAAAVQQNTDAPSKLACRSLSGGGPGMPLTARVERGPS